MDELPIELIIEIFEFINVKERIRLRCLSKRYKFIIDNYINKYTDLIIYYDTHSMYSVRSFKCLNDRLYDLRWIFTDKYLDLNNSIHLLESNKHYFNSILYDQKFDNIQKLFIELCSDDLSFLSRFNKLDCLQVTIIRLSGLSSEDFYINNNNLTKLKIYLLAEEYLVHFKTFFINCPKLKYLCLNGVSNIQLLNSNSVIYLKSQDCIYLDGNFLKYFPSLEVWELSSNFRDSKLNLSFPDIINLIREANSKIKKIIIHRLSKERIRELIKLIKNNPSLDLRNEIQIYLNGLLLGDNIKIINHIKLYYSFISDNLPYLLDLYSYLSDYLPQIKSLDYSVYESELLENKIPDGFIKKLVCLEELLINKQLVDSNRFFKFVFYFDRIYILNINNFRLLPNDFYSNLGRYMPKLFKLNLRSYDNKNISNFDNFDLNFLLKLKCLEYIDVDDELKLNFVKDLFVNLNHLESIVYLKRTKNDIKNEIKIKTIYAKMKIRNLYLSSSSNCNKIEISTRYENLNLEFNLDYNFDLDPDKLSELYENFSIN